METQAQITLDPSFGEASGEDVPAPVSFFDHVARSTGSARSLVPTPPIWPFGGRKTNHRTTAH